MLKARATTKYVDNSEAQIKTEGMEFVNAL